MNARPDVYYGEVAANYQPSREVKAKWKAEQAAVERFLADGQSGSVLDVPFGTGRFVPTYREKQLFYFGIDISLDMLVIAQEKYGEVSAALGSAFDMPFVDNSFGTVVCVRFLEWLPLETATALVDKLRRIAPNIIVTITHGIEGRPEAYTYDYGKFLHAIDGLLIDDRQVTAQVRDMTSEIFKLRPAKWADVAYQFWHDYTYWGQAETNVQRIADKHAAFFGLSPVPINKDCAVRAEYWSGEKIGSCIGRLVDHRFITDTLPRRDDLPMTVVERDGVALIIDGRKRANIWMKQPGPHPVLVVRP